MTIRQSVTIPEDHRLKLEIKVPKDLPAGHAEVTVEILSTRRPDRAKALAALRKLSEGGGIRSISDPVEWQRETRRDRALPGRS